MKQNNNEIIKIAISENKKTLYFTGTIKNKNENFITIHTTRNETITINTKNIIWIKTTTEDQQ